MLYEHSPQRASVRGLATLHVPCLGWLGDATSGGRSDSALKIDWSAPPLCIPLKDGADPGSFLAFSPISPKVGTPEATFVTDPEEAPRSARGVFFVYQGPSGTIYWISESISEINHGDLERLASTCDPRRGCQGTWSLVTIREGTEAVLIQGVGSDATTSLVWLRGRLRMQIMGPSGGLSRREAVTTDSL